MVQQRPTLLGVDVRGGRLLRVPVHRLARVWPAAECNPRSWKTWKRSDVLPGLRHPSLPQVANLQRMVGYLLEAGNSREAVVQMLATSL